MSIYLESPFEQTEMFYEQCYSCFNECYTRCGLLYRRPLSPRVLSIRSVFFPEAVLIESMKLFNSF